MSDAWACIYRKNTPGYPNPWDLCAAEVDSILRCSEPLYSLPLTVYYSGYTLGMPDATKGDLTLYASSSGVYEILVMSGDTSSITPCSGAFVHLVLAVYKGAAASTPFLDSGFTVNSTGYASGIFRLPSSDVSLSVSGFAAAVSGSYNGLYSVVESLNVFPVPPANAIFDAIADTVTLNITNADGLLPAQGVLEASVNSLANPVTLQTYDLDHGVTSSPDYVLNHLNPNFYYIAPVMLPSGFYKGVTGPITSGGHPPALTGLSLRWIYLDSTLPDPSPCLEVDVPANKTDQFDPSHPISIEWSTDNISFSPLVNTTPVDPTVVTQIGTGAGAFIYDITELVGDGFYYIRASGEFYDTSFNYFYGPMLAGTADMGAIKAFAETSPVGCGVDVRWEGPPVALGYQIKIGVSATDPSPMVVPATEKYSYFHNTLDHCGTPYWYTVCRVDLPTICSNQVSGSGILNLNPPNFYTYPMYVDPTNPARPTTEFYAVLNWNNSDYDIHADNISGTRFVLGDSSQNGPVEFTYSAPPGHVNTGVVDTPTFELFTGFRNSVTYTMQLTSGENPPIFGDFRTAFATIPRQQTAPQMLTLSAAGSDVTVTFTGLAWMDPLEYYQLWRTDGTTPQAIATIKGGNLAPPSEGGGGSATGGTTVYVDTSLPAGTWTYYVEAYAFVPPDTSFVARSNFSNEMSITI